MCLQIKQHDLDFLKEYSSISCKFHVSSVLELKFLDAPFLKCEFKEKTIEVPYEKDFDENLDERPLYWNKMFDLSNWGIFAAYLNNLLVGACAVAVDTPNCNMLGGRKDLSVLWDIRVHPDFRQKQIGTALFNAAIEFSKKQDCKFMKIESQNNNVRGCHFYQKKGCYLAAFDRFAYPKYLQEIMLIWYYDLA